MIDRTKIKKLPIYGNSIFANENPFMTFRIGKNGLVDSIYETHILSKTELILTINDDVHGNTYQCPDAIQITRSEWLSKVSELKKQVNSFR
jgi:hypothetical protein